MIQQWIKNISPQAAKIIDHFQDVKEFGKSNPYIVIIESKVPVDTQVNLFGANVTRFSNSTLKPPAGVTIKYGYDTYSYEEFLANTQNSPFEIGILRIETNNPNNFVARNFDLGVIKNEPTGEQTTTNFPVYKRLNQFEQNAVEFDLTNHKFIIDGDVLFTINVFAVFTTIRLFFYPSARASFKMLMNEGYLAKTNTMPSIPLMPNREIYYKPLDVKLNDKSARVIV